VCNRTVPRCDQCVADALDHLGGVAASRGCAWAQACSRVVPLDRAWPPTNDRMRGMARRKVDDLASGDERLRELLADVVIEGARGWWDCVLRNGLWRVG
jgi:hypothetical protein